MDMAKSDQKDLNAYQSEHKNLANGYSS